MSADGGCQEVTQTREIPIDYGRLIALAPMESERRDRTGHPRRRRRA